VGDRDDGHAKFLSQLAHQLQNLSLYGHVQRGGGFIVLKTLGSDSAMAIITRWRMPPENWCGNHPAGALHPDADESRAPGRVGGHLLCWYHVLAQVFMIWEPMVNTGFSEVMGSEDEADARTAYRTQLVLRAMQQVDAVEHHQRPADHGRGLGSSPRSDIMVTGILPKPLSPTTPSSSPGLSSKLTLFTACISERVLKRVLNWFTCNTGAMVSGMVLV